MDSASFNTLTQWIDLGLMSSVLLLVYRSLRVPNALRQSQRLSDLEVSLQSLIKEATSAGDLLNQELQERRRELEKLLKEIELSGGRLGQARLKAEALLPTLKSDLEALTSGVDSLKLEIERGRITRQTLTELHAKLESERIPKAPTFTGRVSFQLRDVGRKAKLQNRVRPGGLEEQIELDIINDGIPKEEEVSIGRTEMISLKQLEVSAPKVQK